MQFKDFINQPGIKKIDNTQENLSKITWLKNHYEICTLQHKTSKTLVDLRDNLTKEIEQYIPIMLNQPEALEIIRHDLAHIMADALQRIYGKNHKIKFAIGPVIEHGFYYDFEIDHVISPEDLSKIEEKMSEIQQENLIIDKYLVPRNLALEFFRSQNDDYKIEIIQNLDEKELITIYACDSFYDLCRGPHFLKTKFPAYFKLHKIAGAYWRGDHTKKMLTRIYGIAFANKIDLKNHLNFLEEAQKRDHRKLGPELGLFHLQEEAQGQVFWHPKGFTVYKIIEDYIRQKLIQSQYVEVKTPLLANRVLWEKSGHWEKFKENMFTVEQKEEEQNRPQFAIKPMNCPLHVQIFNQRIHSYRDLPLRMAEFGCCHRHESSGALHGIMRVLSFTQDDAHIFCTSEQITQEIIDFCNLLKNVYQDFGFKEILVKFSDRPVDPKKRAGTDEIWDQAEHALKYALEQTKLPYLLNHGEGAFYGPKLEFVLKDAIGRDWQCGTIQVDFVLPERLDANYINQEGKKTRPVMLHRAIIGTFERFIGILIENYAGNFPFWLSPTQIMIINVTNEVDQYALEVFEFLKTQAYLDKNQISKPLRVEIDLENATLNFKLKKYSQMKIPLIIIIGKQEAEQKKVSLRYFGSQKTLNCELSEVMQQIKENFSS